MHHQFSCVHPGAKIHPSVEIGPFSTIEDDVEIGEGTVIDSNVTIKSGARIGRNCRIYPGAVIAGEPQDLKFKGEYSIVKIGDNTTLRECVTVHRGTASKGVTSVGDNCLIMAYSHVAHDCAVGNHVIISNACQIAGEVVIDDYAVVGGGTLIHQFCHLGSHVMIQGGALINKDIPPYAIAAHEPISFMGVNSIGLRRRGFTDEEMATIQEAYRILYKSGENFSDAADRIEKELPPSKERDVIVDFIRSSNRGIVRAYTK